MCEQNRNNSSYINEVLLKALAKVLDERHLAGVVLQQDKVLHTHTVPGCQGALHHDPDSVTAHCLREKEQNWDTDSHLHPWDAEQREVIYKHCNTHSMSRPSESLENELNHSIITPPISYHTDFSSFEIQLNKTFNLKQLWKEFLTEPHLPSWTRCHHLNNGFVSSTI